MVDLFLLNERQIARIKPDFPLAHDIPRVEDRRRETSGIAYVIKQRLQWKDTPKNYGPYKTLYNRFIRWNRLGDLPASLQPSREMARNQNGS